MATAVPGVGIYIRKSTDRQELSLPAQERLIRAFLDHSGIELPVQAVYRDVLSGKRPDRGGYQEMLADARLGKLKMIVFHKVNRFGRNTAEGMAAIEELRRLGIIVRIVDMPSLDIHSPEGMFVFTLMLGQGQYEVENLSNEARKGMVEKVEQGGWAWRAPDGYINRREEIAARKYRAWVEVDRPRAAIVRLIYRWYGSGQTTLRGIVRRLNALHEQRITRGKPGCARRSGKRWDWQAVYKILTNRFYLGEIVVPSWEVAKAGKHPAIVSVSAFNRVQATLKRQGHLKNHRYTYLLQNMLQLNTTPPIPLRCTTARRGTRTYTYYFWYSEERRMYLDAPTIDAAVLERIRERIATLGPSPMAAVQERIEHAVLTLHTQAELRAQEVQRERQRLLRLASQGRFTEVEVDAELARLEYEANRARADLLRAQAMALSHEPAVEEALEALEALANWDELAITARRAAVAQLVVSVELAPDGQVAQIHWQPLWDALWFGV